MTGQAILHFWIAVVVAVAALAALAGSFRAVRGTTLLAVWCWAVMAVAAVGLAEVVSALAPGWLIGGRGEAIRYAAAAVAFCPVVALLGAKRPQDRAWQLIVFSFWVILALPAWQTLLLRPDQALAVHPIWSWFLVVLVIVGVTNYMPTRYALAVIFAGAGQILLIWRQLPWGGGIFATADWLPITGLALIALGAATAAFGALQRARAVGEPLARLWEDFCDCYGVVWGLRVAERVNATAAQNGSPLRLTWHGVVRADGAALETIRSDDIEILKATLLPLLGRFVSRAWIETRP